MTGTKNQRPAIRRTGTARSADGTRTRMRGFAGRYLAIRTQRHGADGGTRTRVARLEVWSPCRWTTSAKTPGGRSLRPPEAGHLPGRTSDRFLGVNGSQRSVMPACAGVRPPLRELHFRHAAMQLPHSD